MYTHILKKKNVKRRSEVEHDETTTNLLPSTYILYYIIIICIYERVSEECVRGVYIAPDGDTVRHRRLWAISGLGQKKKKGLKRDA